MHVVVLMPCLDDAATAAELVREVHAELLANGYTAAFLLVDDGSNPPLADSLSTLRLLVPADVMVLKLVRNLGHQRAIACGLCHLNASGRPFDAVVILDSDGEDRPEDVPRLVEALTQGKVFPQVVFAERKRRTEGFVFRTGYWFYLGLHWVIIGAAPRVGNFSCLSSAMVRVLATDPDLWSHYAATICKSRTRSLRVPVARGVRRRGRSRLNLAALVLHGLAAISCYRETLVLRALFGSGILLALATTSFGWALAESWRSAELTSPIFATGLAFSLSLQFLFVALWQCFNVMQNRQQATFIPARDYVHFVPEQALMISQPDSSPVVKTSISHV